MRAQRLRTPQEIKEEWFRKGMTQSAWARSHGFNPVTVGQVLAGKNLASRGQGHVIAVKLGIKDGEIAEGRGDEDA